MSLPHLRCSHVRVSHVLDIRRVKVWNACPAAFLIVGQKVLRTPVRFFLIRENQLSGLLGTNRLLWCSPQFCVTLWVPSVIWSGPLRFSVFCSIGNRLGKSCAASFTASSLACFPLGPARGEICNTEFVRTCSLSCFSFGLSLDSIVGFAAVVNCRARISSF